MSEKSKTPSSLEAVDIQRCPECGHTTIVRDNESGEVVCVECGYVLSMRITDRGPEWRAFNKEQRDKRTRTGAPSTYAIHDKGLSTTIDWRNRDIRGQNLNASRRSQLYRIRMWQKRIRVSDSVERNLSFALSEITKISDNLSLPRNIFETASVIYRKAIKEQLVRGRSIQSISAATVYIACRQCGFTRTLERIASAANISKKELGRSYRFLVKKFGYFTPPFKPSNYLSRFSNVFETKGRTEEIANEVLTSARKLRLISGRGPVGVAAAAIYIASILEGERITQREIAQIAGVTEVTVRNRYKELAEHLYFTMSL